MLFLFVPSGIVVLHVRSGTGPNTKDFVVSDVDKLERPLQIGDLLTTTRIKFTHLMCYKWCATPVTTEPDLTTHWTADLTVLSEGLSWSSVLGDPVTGAFCSYCFVNNCTSVFKSGLRNLYKKFCEKKEEGLQAILMYKTILISKCSFISR